MSLDQHTKLYLSLAFAAGILITLGYKDFYPDLERRYHDGLRNNRVRRRSSTQVSLKVDEPQDDSPAAPLPAAAIREGIEGGIGNTPLIRIKSLSDATGCDILGKAEFLNAAGNSPKDRVALSMIQMAEAEGFLTPNSGDKVYEGTVGSTGISLAAICRARGYTAHICMPDDIAAEKSDLLLKLGAVVERVRPASIVDKGQFVNMARARAQQHTADPDQKGRGFFADQFENPANYLAHLHGTGPEIFEQTAGRLDAFVAGAGTGGTISGCALYLKPRLPNMKVVLADPQGSGLYNRVKHGVMFSPTEKEGTRRRHQVDSIVEGIGVNRVTHNFEAGRELVDDAVRVTDDQAMMMARWLVERDGLFVGSSSAVNCVAAVKTAMELGPGHRVVTILCDSGTRHLSKFWKKAGTIGGNNEMTMDDILNPKVLDP
ncbi:cysteine synthase 2 [Aureobasidium pullulans EXF-150]|uniref:Cysteine synthase 2 n=1 Tax=Aureobasidium pullulans EXF-150 TaxID=1043002 RepID=A0A074X5H8_AURPU|nr:cysteine synthase 2 [Aureobasidium pullulans EXF-150]KEQ79024.1 cysteine synthase 2 [Aureobasidium pullulans EXF-150]